MKDYIEERAVEIAGYIIETKATVRQTAKQFGISKSTVHKDCTDRLLPIICILESKDTKRKREKQNRKHPSGKPERRKSTDGHNPFRLYIE